MTTKKSFGPLITIIVLLLFISTFAFFYWQTKRQEKRLLAVQETVLTNTQTANAIVNLINASLTQPQP